MFKSIITLWKNQEQVVLHWELQTEKEKNLFPRLETLANPSNFGLTVDKFDEYITIYSTYLFQFI